MSGILASLRRGLTVCLLLAFALHAGGLGSYAAHARAFEAAREVAARTGDPVRMTGAPAPRPCQAWTKCAPYVAPAAFELAPPETVTLPRPRGAVRVLALAEPGLDAPPPRV